MSDPIAAFRGLVAELVAAFREWEERPAPWPESRIDALAGRAFAVQHAGNRPYRLYCDRLGTSPSDVRGWREVPAVPTEAFREVPLCVGGQEAVEAVFRTSGTTRGTGRRGAHPVLDTGLYRASAEAGFRHHVLDGPGPVSMCSLVPPFEPARESSLSWMAEALVRRFGGPGSGFAAGPDGIRWQRAEFLIEAACADGRPVCILATTLAADEWMRRLRDRGARFELPAGSRLMDTGGAKGRPGLDRGRVVEAVGKRLGVPATDVVNEFGMTELLSQRYSRPVDARPTAGESHPEDGWRGSGGAPGGSGEGFGSPAADGVRLHAPPWLRTRALDPVTLDELPEGEAGLLCHFDLANAGSVCAVLTEDLGRVRGNVVEWIGRAAGAPPRGCSLATAELLAAQERR